MVFKWSRCTHCAEEPSCGWFYLPQFAGSGQPPDILFGHRPTLVSPGESPCSSSSDARRWQIPCQRQDKRPFRARQRASSVKNYRKNEVRG